MILEELSKFNDITIQCHDNPDADALASGFGLYLYFESLHKNVELVYCGNNLIHKSNLCIMIDKLQIPIIHVEKDHPVPGILVTVDCQYGSGNITSLTAKNIAVIDHHPVVITEDILKDIRCDYGSCSTIVWKLLEDVDFPLNTSNKLATALYYGLYSDTSQFSEIFNPVDRDMFDSLIVDQNLIHLMQNSNISLQELEIAGLALIRTIYNEHHHFAIIKAGVCDPNILGLISDLCLQVDAVYTCVVFSETSNGIKFSVRSCIKESHANEVAVYLSQGIGSGGGHTDKAGGTINTTLFHKEYGDTNLESYFSERIISYFHSFHIIYAENFVPDFSEMTRYMKTKTPLGYVQLDRIFSTGKTITIRTIDGDNSFLVIPGTFALINSKGLVSIIDQEIFESEYQPLDLPYNVPISYFPTAKESRHDSSVISLEKHVRSCIPSVELQIYAKELDKDTKLFHFEDDSTYHLGKKGDYLAIKCNRKKEAFLIDRESFHKMYQPVAYVES
ncbi:MAG: DHH family phosphoesterase [Lachnospiraceae bacterium]|nr:DHH family phosphoesterase [Lachnospiraceae bacterium]